MAYIATYISTTSSSELSKYWSEVSGLSTTSHEFVIAESYYKVNEVLDSFIQTPLPKQPTTGAYPSSVREAQALYAIYLALQLTLDPGSERVVTAKERADKALDELLKGRAQIEQMYSPDETGIQYPVPGTSNTSTAILQVDRTSSYTGSTEQTYTVTATSSANIGTATCSWSDGEGNTGTFTSDYDFEGLSYGVSVRFMASPSGGVAIVSGNTWKIRCVPNSIKPDVPGGFMRTVPIYG